MLYIYINCMLRILHMLYIYIIFYIFYILCMLYIIYLIYVIYFTYVYLYIHIYTCIVCKWGNSCTLIETNPVNGVNIIFPTSNLYDHYRFDYQVEAAAYGSTYDWASREWFLPT